MPPTAREIAEARLRAAGIPEEAIPGLLERAAALVEGLSTLAELDANLPEPGLIWRPIGDGADEGEE